ncbi:uncharacterized protein LOC111698138 [Eurytemora carolleeae]|uniref:uncharacterized protein LOC111698138 n=1 Tax=Eurytemora carolleeae TaxID=1294199 RepID=UPI000C78A2CA|nr:uncharacterized protein LOC111698138 [Eurytemora carolleeae]|eukprot:XP_023324159.1 uncharacterized protein LOC111698138 [Eurytemora affinis]
MGVFYDEFPFPTFSDENLEEELKYNNREPLEEFAHLSLDVINHYLFKGRGNFSSEFRVLVVGAGTGSTGLYLAEQLTQTNAQIVILEVSKKSMEIAKKRAQIRGLKNIQWIHGSVESLSDIAQTGLFDFIECRHVLDHVVDPTSVLSKMAGILKPNGGISLSINGGVGRGGLIHVQNMVQILTKNEKTSAGKIAAVKEVLKVVPPQNWFHRYKAINPTGHIYSSRHSSGSNSYTDSDIAQFFLKPLDNSFRVGDVYELANKTGLKFVTFSDLSNRITLKLENYLPTNLMKKMAAKDIVTQQKMAELLGLGPFTFHFLLSKETKSEASFDNLDNIPFLFLSPEGLLQVLEEKCKDQDSDGTLSLRMYEDNSHLTQPFSLPCNPHATDFLGSLLKHPGQRTEKILQNLLKKYPELTPEHMFSRMTGFYNAAKHSGQILLRHKSIGGFPRSKISSFYKISRN